MISLAALAAVAHVPIYPDGTTYTLDRAANISQVIYWPIGSGNVRIPEEYHNNSAHVDVVIRDKDDAAHYAIWTQCGDANVAYCCPAADSLDHIQANLCQHKPKCSVKGEGHLEPFTQTSYFSLLPEWHLFECEHDLVIRATRSGDDNHESDHPRGPMGIVVGRGEEFTFAELMSIGHYALLNHGSWWNEAGWTYWVFLTIVAVIVAVTCKMAESYNMRKPVINDKPREMFYWFAIVGFGAAFLETTTHTGIAQAPVPAGGELGIAILIILLNLVFMAVILMNMYLDMGWIQSAVWGPFELGTAFSCFLLFGVGYYVAPSFWMCAALIRTYRLVAGDNSLYKY